LQRAGILSTDGERDPRNARGSGKQQPGGEMSEVMVEEMDLRSEGGQGEELPADSGQEQSSGAGGQNASGDVDWSLNDVPEALRPEVDKFVKHYQGKVTPKLQRLGELEKAARDWEQTGATYQEQQAQLQNVAQQLLWNDQYRQMLQQQYQGNAPAGYKSNAQVPDEWNSPEAQQARQLLWQDFAQQFQQATGLRLQDLRGVAQQAKKADQIELQQASDEYQSVLGQLKKEGLPMSDEIFGDCLAVIARGAQQGQRLSLRAAYDRIMGRGREVEQQRIASQQRKQQGPRPFQPSGPGGKEALTGDAKLAKIIDDLPGAEGLGWSG
jgi:flagellar biosynthesis chaperone FliJ